MKNHEKGPNMCFSQVKKKGSSLLIVFFLPLKVNISSQLRSVDDMVRCAATGGTNQTSMTDTSQTHWGEAKRRANYTYRIKAIVKHSGKCWFSREREGGTSKTIVKKFELFLLGDLKMSASGVKCLRQSHTV